MFSQELENLIQATLEDGVLEENEKAALVKRAEREGVDIAELEIYINSLLQKRARELENEKTAERKKVEKEKKEAFGRKCPNCGAQVPPLTLKCECGYEFTTIKSVSSVQLLSDKLEAILSKPYKKSDPDSDEYKEEVRQRYQRIKETINLFPVPNTKEDIIEFMALSAPNAKKKGGIWGTRSGRTFVKLMISMFIFIAPIIYDMYIADHYWKGLGIFLGIFGGIAALVYSFMSTPSTYSNSTFIHNEMASVWRTKFDQVMMKGRSLRGDAEFTRQLDYYESMLNEK